MTLPPFVFNTSANLDCPKIALARLLLIWVVNKISAFLSDYFVNLLFMGPNVGCKNVRL